MAFVDDELAAGPHARATQHSAQCPECAAQVSRRARRAPGAARRRWPVPALLAAVRACAAIPQDAELPRSAGRARDDRRRPAGLAAAGPRARRRRPRASPPTGPRPRGPRCSAGCAWAPVSRSPAWRSARWPSAPRSPPPRPSPSRASLAARCSAPRPAGPSTRRTLDARLSLTPDAVGRLGGRRQRAGERGPRPVPDVGAPSAAPAEPPRLRGLHHRCGRLEHGPARDPAPGVRQR